MRYTKWFAGLALVAGFSATTLAAQDWRYAPAQRSDVRSDYRDIDHDYDRVARMRADIARDQARLNEDIRCGRSQAAARDAADLARDQRALQAQTRDIRSDRNDIRRDVNRDSYRSSYRYWR